MKTFLVKEIITIEKCYEVEASDFRRRRKMEEIEIYRECKKAAADHELEVLIVTIDDVIMVFTAFMFPTTGRVLDEFFKEV